LDFVLLVEEKVSQTIWLLQGWQQGVCIHIHHTWAGEVCRGHHTCTRVVSGTCTWPLKNAVGPLQGQTSCCRYWAGL